MRRLIAALAAAVLVLFGTVAGAGTASAAPGEVTITAPGEDGEDNTPMVEGTADPSTVVHLLVNDTEVATPPADGAGHWSFQLTDPLTRGETAFVRAEVLDNDGQIVGDTLLLYTPWLEKQTLRIVSPSPDEVQGTMFEVRSMAEPADYLDVRLLVDGVESGRFFGPEADGAFLNVVEDVGDGAHVLQVRANDRYGRLIESATIEVRVDATPPSKPTIDSPTNGAVIREGKTLFEGTADPSSEIKLEFDGSGERLGATTADAQGHWTYTVDTKTDFTWAKGKLVKGIRLDARSRDAAGNAAFSDILTVDIDLRKATPPATSKPAPTTPGTSKPAGSAIPAAAPSAAQTAQAAQAAQAGQAGQAGQAALELAHTGPSALPGTAVALLLLSLGLGLTSVSRKLAPAQR